MVRPFGAEIDILLKLKDLIYFEHYKLLRHIRDVKKFAFIIISHNTVSLLWIMFDSKGGDMNVEAAKKRRSML